MLDIVRPSGAGVFVAKGIIRSIKDIDQSIAAETKVLRHNRNEQCKIPFGDHVYYCCK